jgi:hypothetical protein
VLHSLSPSAWLIAVVAPLFLFTLPIVNSSTMTLIQTKTEPKVLGRVLAAARVVGDASIPVSYLLAGPLADQVFEPLMRPDGALAGSVGTIVGTGDGRGTALVFAVVGTLMVLLVAFAWSRRSLREVDNLPDALEPEAPTPTPEPEPAAEPAEPVRG